MTATDPYLTLGIPPDADEPTIRAAYRAGMKRFHPDQNPSADAAEKSRGIATAYRLLSNPEERARHDRQRQYHAQVIVPTIAPLPRTVSRGRAGGLLLVAISVAIVAFAVNRLDPARPPPTPAQRNASATATATATATAEANESAPEAVVPVAPPVAASAQELSQSTPIAPLARARSATADTLLSPPPLPARLPARVALSDPKSVASPVPLIKQRKPARRVLPASDPTTTPAAASRPTPDECDVAASCARIDLAALERMQTLLYNQSLQNAPAPKQALLLSTRATFQARLGHCASAVCKRDAYLDRNREIAALMRS